MGQHPHTSLQPQRPAFTRWRRREHGAAHLLPLGPRGNRIERVVKLATGVDAPASQTRQPLQARELPVCRLQVHARASAGGLRPPRCGCGGGAVVLRQCRRHHRLVLDGIHRAGGVDEAASREKQIEPAQQDAELQSVHAPREPFGPEGRRGGRELLGRARGGVRWVDP
eukprot:scaffold6645_cov79-Isochrysis_galbana.AAC.1